MPSKVIIADFYVTKKQMIERQRDMRDYNQRTYFYYFEGANDSYHAKYSLRFYNVVDEKDVFRVGLKVTEGSSFYASGGLRLDDVGYNDEDDAVIEKKEYQSGDEHDILSGDFGLLFKYRDEAVITLEIKIELISDKSVIALPLPTVSDHINDASHETFDVCFVIGEENIPAHRGFLSMISPVFQAMFANDTKEAETGIIEITDFDFAAVKNAMEYCYGQDTGVKTASEVVAILRFADKYDIKTVIKRCDAVLETHITHDNFGDIAEYAWIFNKPRLQSHSIEFFRKEHFKLTLTPAFVKVPMAVKEAIIQGAFAIH